MAKAHKKAMQVFNKTRGRCSYCGVYLNKNNFQVDHATPKIQGGTSDLHNLLPACQPCNHLKKGRTVDEFRQYLVDRLTKSMDELGVYQKLVAPFIDESSSFAITAITALVECVQDKIEIEFHIDTIGDLDD